MICRLFVGFDTAISGEWGIRTYPKNQCLNRHEATFKNWTSQMTRWFETFHKAQYYC